jgi:hypothetical protein
MPLDLLVPGGISAVVSLIILLWARGRLIPVSTVDKLEARYQAEIDQLRQEVAGWKVIADRERANADQKQAQLDKLLIVADTTERLMNAMREKALQSRVEP